MQYCDSVVVGEGEPVWQQVLADAEANQLRPYYRCAKPFDLSQAPIPRFELLGSKTRPRVTVQRGCPLACEFCGASRLLGPHRIKPAHIIGKELEIATGLIEDPVVDRTRRRQHICRPVRQHTAIGRPRRVRRGLLHRSRSANRRATRPARTTCRIRVRSGAHRHRVDDFPRSGMGPKSAELSRIMNAVAAIQDAGVAVIGCFIVGCDGESRASLDRRSPVDCPLADIQLTLQTPFPGTAPHSRLGRQGRLLADRDWSHYTLFDVTYQPNLMAVEELESEFRILFATFAPVPTARRAEIRRQIWRRTPGCAHGHRNPAPLFDRRPASDRSHRRVSARAVDRVALCHCCRLRTRIRRRILAC